MNGMEAQAGLRPVGETTTKTIAGGAIMESVGAVATIALGIIGLAGILSTTLAAIATIVLGAAIWIEGGAYMAAFKASSATGMARMFDWSEGLSAEVLGALSGIVLGILALLGIAPVTLLSVAVLVFGATFLFSSMEGMATGSQTVLGLAALVLGILSVVGHSPLTLVLVALVCLGASALFSGAAHGARVASTTTTVH